MVAPAEPVLPWVQEKKNTPTPKLGCIAVAFLLATSIHLVRMLNFCEAATHLVLQMKTLLTSLLCSLFFTAICSATPDVDALVKVGDIAPAFTLATTDGTVVSTDQSKGKLILVNFFATWCPPCMEEMPRMETEVWQKFKDRGLVVVAIAREQPNDLLATFKSTKNFTLPIAGDLKREVYAKYAKQFIPRNFLIGPDGKVLFASSGYNATEFAEMTKLIDVELSKLK